MKNWFYIVCIFCIKCSAQNLRITQQAWKDAQSVSEVSWNAESNINEVYCLGSEGYFNLDVKCENCNETSEFSRFLANRQQDFSNTLGFAAIGYSNIPMSQEIHGKTLSCEGQSENGLQRTTAIININYLDRPYITDSSNSKPSFVPGPKGGNRFYLECNRGQNGICTSEDSIELRCVAQGNPNPDKFWWTGSGGQTIANGQSFRVSSDQLYESVSCQANNGRKWHKVSSAVKIDSWERPRLNFSMTQPRSLSDGRVKIDSKVTFSCQIYGYPRPTVFWMRESDGKIYNGSCESANVIRQNEFMQQFGLFKIDSQCDLTIKNYSTQGAYWCSGPPQKVTFSPQMDYRIIRKSNDSKDITIQVDFCADPQPTREGIEWKIGDDIKILAGNKNDHYKAERVRKNGTDCFVASLLLSPLKENDKELTFQLIIKNIHGQERITFTLPDWLIINENSAFMKSGLWILLALILLIILIIIISYICWKKCECACCFFLCETLSACVCCKKCLGKKKPPERIPEKDYYPKRQRLPITENDRYKSEPIFLPNEPMLPVFEALPNRSPPPIRAFADRQPSFNSHPVYPVTEDAPQISPVNPEPPPLTTKDPLIDSPGIDLLGDPISVNDPYPTLPGDSDYAHLETNNFMTFM